jgi:hypothetical protein
VRFATLKGEFLIVSFMKSTGLCSIISFIGGALVGSAAAMLFTPQSGQELRSKIRNYINEEAEKMRCNCDEK